MDLLGSILNSMDKPPALDEKQKKINKSKPNTTVHCFHASSMFLLLNRTSRRSAEEASC